MDEMDIFLQGDVSEGDLIEVADVGEEVDDPTEEEDNQEDKKKKNKDNNKEELLEVDEVEDTEDAEDVLPEKSEINKPNSKNTSNTISSFVKAFQEEGILNLTEDKEITSLEELYDAIADEKERYHTEQLDMLPEANYRQALQAIKSGVPIEEVLGYQANIERYNDITHEAIDSESSSGEALRKKVLMESFIAKGFSEDKAQRFVRRSFDAGDDKEDAKEALVELKASEQAKFEQAQVTRQAQVKEAEANRVKAIEDFNKLIKDTKELIPGQRLTPKMKKSLYDNMTKGVAVIDTPNGKQSVDGLNKFLADKGVEGRLLLNYIIEITDGGKNLDVLAATKAKREATKQLESQLSTDGSVEFSRDNHTSFGADDFWKYVN